MTKKECETMVAEDIEAILAEISQLLLTRKFVGFPTNKRSSQGSVTLQHYHGRVWVFPPQAQIHHPIRVHLNGLLQSDDDFTLRALNSESLDYQGLVLIWHEAIPGDWSVHVRHGSP